MGPIEAQVYKSYLEKQRQALAMVPYWDTAGWKQRKIIAEMLLVIGELLIDIAEQKGGKDGPRT